MGTIGALLALATSGILQAGSADRYRDKVFSEVEVRSDLPYKEARDHAGKTIPLRIDLYEPKGDQAPSRPALIWVHGGALSTGSKDGGVEARFGEAFARRGYVVASVQYRLRPNPDADFNGAMRDAMEDVRSALLWLRERAKEVRVDPTRIALGGYSAGGEIVTNLVYTDFVKEMDRRQVAAVLDLAGNTLFYSEPFEGSPPCLIVHGEADDINPISASRNLKERLEKTGIACELLAMEGEDHFFRKSGSMDRVEAKFAEFLFRTVVARTKH